MKTRYFLWIPAILFLTGASCSRLDLALRWADTFVMYQVTDYFELTSEQKREARDEFNRALDEVRSEDFSKLATRLREIADLAEKDAFNAENIEVQLKGLESAFLEAGRRFEPMAQKLIRDQVPKNFTQFDAEVMKKYEKDLRRAENPAQARAKLKDRVEEIVDDTIEHLTDAQKSYLKDWLQQTTPPQKQQVENRKIVLEKFRAVRGDEATRTAFVRDFFYNWDRLQGEEYLKAREDYHQKIRELVVRLATTLNEKQRESLAENLRSRASELDRLAKPK